MHLQITLQYIEYKSLKGSCSICINLSNNIFLKGCELHLFPQLPLHCTCL